MAIFYCDYVNGNDASDGLTTATPKKTLNAITALPTVYTDEVRVRGMDSLLTDIGSWTWTNESNTIVRTGGDYRALAPANSYVCKTVTISGTTVPEIYQVLSVAFAGGNTTATLNLNFNPNQYVGTTETVPTSTLVLPTAIATQTLNKNGFISGNAYDKEGRILTKITGGWNSIYTAQSTYTFHYGTVTNLLNLNSKTNWEFSKFIIITTGAIAVAMYNTNTFKNTFAGWNAGVGLSGNMQYIYLNNVKVIGSNTALVAANYDSLYDNCVLLNSRTNAIIGGGTSETIIKNSILGFSSNTSVFSNAILSIKNSTIYNMNRAITGGGLVNFTGCTLIDKGNSAGILFNPNGGNIVNCTFDMNANRSYPNDVSYVYGSPAAFYGNSGKTGQFMYLNINGAAYNTTRFRLFRIQNFANLRWYNYNNEDLDLNGYNSGQIENNSKSIIYNYTTGTTKNAILCEKGYTTMSDTVYSGSTSIKHVVSTNTTTTDFNNVDFVVNKANGYTLSFYAKGSGSFTMHWNIFNGGQYLYSWQTQAINSSTWTNISKSIANSDWKMSGTATLVIRIPSQAKGTYALIDYITLT